MKHKIDVTARMVFWHATSGQRIAMLTKQTDKYTYLVMLREARGVVLLKVPNMSTSKGGRQVPIRLRDASIGSGQPYPVRRARAHYRRMGKAQGITQAALDALREAI